MNEKLRKLKNQIIDRLFTLIAFLGILFIIYGVFTTWFLSKWPPIEYVSSIISILVTIFATLFTVISIYFPIKDSPPTEMSKFIVVPLIIISLIIVTIYAISNDWNISPHILTGFSLLALSGALFRLYGREETM